MKSLLVILSLTLSLGAMALETGMGPNGPYTVGPLGYTDPFYTSVWTGQMAAGTSVLPTASSGTSTLTLQVKALAQAVENDAQNYLQTGEMSVLLGTQVNQVLAQNAELSVDEAVSVVLDFAAIHTGN